MLEISIDNCNKCNTETINDPNVTFQPNKIFVRNDLSEKIIKSCKATNLEFLKLNGQEFILMPEKSFIQNDVENNQLKEENEKL